MPDDDLPGLAAWARDTLGRTGVTARRLREGHSNLTYVLTDATGAELILRRPPAGPLHASAHDVLREHRVLALLAGRRVPRVLAACADETVIGAPFYVMERVPGDVVRLSIPAWLGPGQRRTAGLDLADTLAELHAQPVEPLLAAGVGRPGGGYLARQLRRWGSQRDAATAAGLRTLPDDVAVRAWLHENLPTDGGSALVHGDYKLDNVVLDPATARVAAVLDWEMATVGDPLADLGYLLSQWPEPGEQVPFLGTGAPTAQGGWPTRAELAERYAQASGRPVGELTWYVVLAVWKLAALLEASYARHLAGTTDDPFFAELAHGVPDLLARARAVAGV